MRLSTDVLIGINKRYWTDIFTLQRAANDHAQLVVM